MSTSAEISICTTQPIRTVEISQRTILSNRFDESVYKTRYAEVWNGIRTFNTLRAAQGASGTLPEAVDMNAVVRHIINASAPTATKGYVRVLDIGPGNPYDGSGTSLSKATVQNTWLKVPSTDGI